MDLLKEYESYKKSGGSYRKLGELLGLNHAYISMAVNNSWGEYKLSEDEKKRVENRIRDFFKSKQLKVLSKYDEICDRAEIIPFANTTIIMTSIIKAIKQRALLKIVGKSGTGKTTAVMALKEYIPHIVIVTAYAGMSKKELLDSICSALGVMPRARGQQHLMAEIVNYLGLNDKILIIDEANFLSKISLEQIRYIQDATRAPIVLVGTENLNLQIAQSHEQVATRIRGMHQELSQFGESEVSMLFEKSGIEIDSKAAANVWKRCTNLREVKYSLDDLVELYGGDIKELDKVLPRRIR